MLQTHGMTGKSKRRGTVKGQPGGTARERQWQGRGATVVGAAPAHAEGSAAEQRSHLVGGVGSLCIHWWTSTTTGFCNDLCQPSTDLVGGVGVRAALQQQPQRAVPPLPSRELVRRMVVLRGRHTRKTDNNPS